jgi:pyruvyltransferase
MNSQLQASSQTLRDVLRRLNYRRSRSLYWSRTDIPNWGDDLNPWLFQKLTGSSAIYCPHGRVPKLLMAGSILASAGPNDYCWGTGLITAEIPEGCGLATAHALRGPATASALENIGLPSSDIFGDPGVLVAKFVTPPPAKRYAMAVIPHYADAAAGAILAKELNAKLIPVSHGIEEFVRAVAQAEVVYSSSLHGIICAESLGVPAVWVVFSDNLIGGDFKFRDYIAGTDRDSMEAAPLDLRREKSESAIRNALRLPAYNIEAITKRLLKCFPLKLCRAAEKLSLI